MPGRRKIIENLYEKGLVDPREMKAQEWLALAREMRASGRSGAADLAYRRALDDGGEGPPRAVLLEYAGFLLEEGSPRLAMEKAWDAMGEGVRATERALDLYLGGARLTGDTELIRRALETAERISRGMCEPDLTRVRAAAALAAARMPGEWRHGTFLDRALAAMESGSRGDPIAASLAATALVAAREPDAGASMERARRFAAVVEESRGIKGMYMSFLAFCVTGAALAVNGDLDRAEQAVGGILPAAGDFRGVKALARAVMVMVAAARGRVEDADLKAALLQDEAGKASLARMDPAEWHMLREAAELAGLAAATGEAS